MPIGLGTRRGRAVSLEQGAGPGAARCPACGEPLFVWLEIDMKRVASPSDGLPEDQLIDRCENCGLAVTRDAVPSADQAADELLSGGERGGGRIAVRAANAASLQAWLGAENWAALADLIRVAPEPNGSRLAARPRVTPSHRGIEPTPKSVALLLERRGLHVRRIRHLARAGMASMWQTLLNLLTFHRDFAVEVAAGRLRPGTGRSRAAFWTDAAVTALAATPTAIIAVVLEAGAVLARRGGVIEIHAEPLPDPQLRGS
jgi:hypothetical protein